MRPLRLVLFSGSALVLAASAVALALHMPTFGAHPLPYGDAVNALAPGARNVTNMVSAINFDLRALDTLGEEFMLVAAVTGAAVLLRGSRGVELSAEPGRAPRRAIPPRSEPVALLARWLAPLTIMFGIYVVLHAQLTPGGGFQGGVIAASGALLLFLADGYRGWRRIVRPGILHAGEGGGTALYLLAGLAPMLAGAPFLANLLPLGPSGSILSGGLIPVLNLGVALAVAGGFATLFLEFLEETRAPKVGGERDE